MFTFVISRTNNNDEFFKSDLFSVNHSNEKKNLCLQSQQFWKICICQIKKIFNVRYINNKRDYHLVYHQTGKTAFYDSSCVNRGHNDPCMEIT